MTTDVNISVTGKITDEIDAGILVPLCVIFVDMSVDGLRICPVKNTSVEDAIAVIRKTVCQHSIRMVCSDAK